MDLQDKITAPLGLATLDKFSAKTQSPEQYAIDTIGGRALKTTNTLIKKGRQATMNVSCAGKFSSFCAAMKIFASISCWVRQRKYSLRPVGQHDARDGKGGRGLPNTLAPVTPCAGLD